MNNNASSINSHIKVTYNGETKRVQPPDSYQELLDAMKRSFPAIIAIEEQAQYKFFFLDEDQEFISISSQEDFNDNREYILVSPEA